MATFSGKDNEGRDFDIDLGNSGWDGDLEAEGNVVNVDVNPIVPTFVDAFPPGWGPGVYGYRAVGVKPRTVTWRCRTKASSDALLTEIEDYLDYLVATGAMGALSSCAGRSFDYACLVQLDKVGFRKRLTAGCVLQDCVVTFRVLWQDLA